MTTTFIIAEAGVNHNGELTKAFQLIDIAVTAGADAIKFQTYRAKNLVTQDAAKAKYQKKETNEDESQFDMLKKVELSYPDHFELLNYCNQKNIKFMSSAFDQESLSFLVNELKLDLLKIPSGEITNGPFLLDHARTGCNVILSTGMSNLQEIQDALSILAFGYFSDLEPTRKLLEATYDSRKGKKILKEKVTLMHCTSQYPAPSKDINLSAITTMQKKFNLRVGFSDHSEGTIIPTNAVTLGASVIEKHFTIDKLLPGPDHKASLNPEELKNMITNIRITEKSLGNGVKTLQPSEQENKNIARKSIFAKETIRKGDIFSSKNLVIKRPGDGRSPMDFWEIVGESSDKDYLPEDFIK